MQLDTVSYFFTKAILIHLMKIKSKSGNTQNKIKSRKKKKFFSCNIFCLSRIHSKQFMRLHFCCGILILFALSVIHSDHLHSLNSLGIILNRYSFSRFLVKEFDICLF